MLIFVCLFLSALRSTSDFVCGIKLVDAKSIEVMVDAWNVFRVTKRERPELGIKG